MSEFRPSRRTVARGAAWAVPAVVVGTQAPAFAASCAPLAAPMSVTTQLNGPAGAISGSYGCWGPGKGSGSDGCTGATEPRRFFVGSDGVVGPANNCDNYLVLQRTQEYSSTIANGDLGPRNYTFTGTALSSYGHHNYVASHGAGLALQTNFDGGAWTTRAHYVTRDATDVNPMNPADFAGCSWYANIAAVPSVTIQPPRATVCQTVASFASLSYSFTVAVPSGVQKIGFRRVYYVAPRVTATLCGGTSASDDWVVSDATITCA